MKTTYFTILFLLSYGIGSAQYGSATTPQDWRTMVLVSKKEGIHTSGLHFEYLQNTNNWWGDWLLPWRISFQIADIRPEKFEKTNYTKATFSHATIGLGGYKTISETLYLNIDAGVILGSENLTERTGKQFDRFFLGLSSFQGLLFIPN